jgi:hypothetical protein
VGAAGVATLCRELEHGVAADPDEFVVLLRAIAEQLERVRERYPGELASLALLSL